MQLVSEVAHFAQVLLHGKQPLPDMYFPSEQTQIPLMLEKPLKQSTQVSPVRQEEQKSGQVVVQV